MSLVYPSCYLVPQWKLEAKINKGEDCIRLRFKLLENRDYGLGIRRADHATTYIRKNWH
jgi:hypothetical protein